MNFIKLVTLLSVLFVGSLMAHETQQHQSREQVGWQRIESGALIIDVRTAQEYAQGHIKGAVNVPFDVAVAQFKALEIRKDRNIVLYCRSGNRSGKAFNSLKAAGYSKLHNGGGFDGMIKVKP